MTEYTSAIATARRLITRKGRSIYLVAPSAAVGVAIKPWRGSLATASNALRISAVAVFTKFAKNEIDGKTILATDQKVIISDLEVGTADIEKFKTIEDGSNNYRIINYDIVKPGDEIIIYKLQVRS